MPNPYSLNNFSSFPTFFFRTVIFPFDVCRPQAIPAFTIVSSTFQLQFHFQRVFSQSAALQGTNEAFGWRFGSYFFCGQRRRCSHTVGVSVGIFPLSYSKFCRRIFCCKFPSLHERLLSFEVALSPSWPERNQRLLSAEWLEASS